MASPPNGPRVDCLDQLKNAIKANNWEELVRVILDDSNTVKDVFQETSEEKNNILHSAIERNTPEKGTTVVTGIFKAIETKFPKADLFDFVNHMNEAGKFPLDVAFEGNSFQVVTILIRNGAEKFSKPNLELLEEIYDTGLTLKRNSFGTTNKSHWLLEYDFSCIIGRTNQPEEFRETKQLSSILDMPREQRSDVMRHPLVQMFVTEKYKKYNWFINFSIIYHTLWSLMSATYIMCINTVVTTEKSSNISTNSDDNITNVEPNIAHICAALKWSDPEDLPLNGVFSWILFVFFVTTILKEALELFLCPSRKYYFNQFENTGQWTSIVALISSSFYTTTFPNYALVPPMILVFVIYCWKVYVKWLGPFDTYFNLSTDLDKYIIVGTCICICFMPTLSTVFWSFFGVYCFGFFISIFLLPFPKIPFYSGEKSCILNRISYVSQGIGILCLLGLFAYFPFEPTCTCNFPSYICATGISASLFLIQGQMTKTESYGVYTQMLIKGFKIISKFLFTFLPILAAYFVIFILLLPDNSNFGLKNGLGIGKIVAMLTGDLGFDDVFSEERIGLIPHAIPANIALTFFAVTVVLLLQNLLVGLTVNDLEKLRTKAVAAHVANRLEIIYLLETVIMSKWSLYFLKLIKLKNKVVIQFSLVKYKCVGNELQLYERLPEENSFCTVKFWELPKAIRDVIVEKQDSYLKT